MREHIKKLKAKQKWGKTNHQECTTVLLVAGHEVVSGFMNEAKNECLALLWWRTAIW